MAIEPTPPPPRSDGSHPLERAAVRLFCPPGTTREWDRECFFASAPPGGAGAVARARRRARPSEPTRRIRGALRRADARSRATRVRALAADAASASAETHLASTLAAHAEFTMRMRERTRRQADLLASFEDDLETLRSTTLETKVLQTPRTTTEGAHESRAACCSLLDLVDVTSLHEWHNSSRDAHDGFVARMESLETRVTDLKRSVERVLATTPDVDVEALEAELDSARDALRAQKDVVDETLADAANARAPTSRCVAALEKRNLLEYDANEPELLRWSTPPIRRREAKRARRDERAEGKFFERRSWRARHRRGGKRSVRRGGNARVGVVHSRRRDGRRPGCFSRALRDVRLRHGAKRARAAD